MAEPSTGNSLRSTNAQADLLREGRDQLGLGQDALVDQHPAERAAGPLVLVVGGRELGRT